MKLSTVVAAVVLAGLASAVVQNDCNRGPSYWCRDQETSIKCGVQAFCNLLNDDSKIKFQPTVKAAAPAVNVSFYYESLCPGCREVWKDQLYPTFQALGGSGIVNFEFVPYGNAREQAYGSSWRFTCQHGASECLGNKIETCAIHYNPEPTKIIPFLHCLEQYNPATNGAYCAGIAKIEWNAINTCAYSSEGSSLEHEMAVKTDSLNPPHQYVPWLTLNGRPSTALSSNMLATVCNAYTGTKPAACSRSQNPESKRCNKE